jgi:hypothetical protein
VVSAGRVLRSNRSFDTDAQVLSCASRPRLPVAGQLRRYASAGERSVRLVARSGVHGFDQRFVPLYLAGSVANQAVHRRRLDARNGFSARVKAAPRSCRTAARWTPPSSALSLSEGGPQAQPVKSAPSGQACGAHNKAVNADVLAAGVRLPMVRRLPLLQGLPRLSSK